VVAGAGSLAPGCTSLPGAATEVSIFVDDDITAGQKSRLEAALRTDPVVRSFRFESREAAYEKFKKLWKDSPDFVASVSPASLPPSYYVTMANPKAYPVFANRIRLFAGTEAVRGQYCTPGTAK
jgi:cell division transport system permease protein